MGDLTGKTAFITGGTSGIGLATAQAFLREGAKVVVSGRDSERLDQAVTQLGDNAVGLQADASSVGEMKRAVDQVAEQHGQIDVMFLNAGPGGSFAPFSDVSESAFDRIMNTNFKGPYFTIQHALPHLGENASIVLTASISASIGQHSLSVYAAGKAALRALARNLATELGPSGVRVNVVSPGIIQTPIFRNVPEEVAQQVLDAAAAQTSIGRVGQAEEIAEAVLFLASSRSSYVIGAELIVDGGYTIVT